MSQDGERRESVERENRSNYSRLSLPRSLENLATTIERELAEGPTAYEQQSHTDAHGTQHLTRKPRSTNYRMPDTSDAVDKCLSKIQDCSPPLSENIANDVRTALGRIAAIAKSVSKPTIELRQSDLRGLSVSIREVATRIEEAKRDVKPSNAIARTPDIDDKLVERWEQFKKPDFYTNVSTPSELDVPCAKQGSMWHYVAWAVDEYDDMDFVSLVDGAVTEAEAEKVGKRIKARKKRNRDDATRQNGATN